MIELLVVIAIIGILAAMLLPALGRAKESSRRAKCMNNLKEIAKATLMYTDDWDGLMPVFTTSDLGRPLWQYFSYASVNTTNKFTVLYCPNADGKPNVTWDGDTLKDRGGAYYTAGLSTYGFNSHVQGCTSCSAPAYRKLAQVDSAHAVIWATDAGGYRINSNNFTTASCWQSIPAYRHGGSGAGGATKPNGEGFNATFLDGHAEWIGWPAFLRWKNAGWPQGQPYAWY